MGNRHKQYHDYYLINDNDNEMTEVDFDLPLPREKRPRCICYTITIFTILLVTFFIITSVIVPIIFMSSKAVQSHLIFTRFSLDHDKKDFETENLPAYQNRYVTLKNSKNEQETLGVWHILPKDLAYKNIYEKPVNFDEALLNSSKSVLIYFHGTGEDRTNTALKYALFTTHFHVIAFDYRGYGDSTSKGEVTEETVVDDCVELYKWVRNRTNSDIYVWGHSLGAALAAETVAILENRYNLKTKGLVLESAFTNLEDELYCHPITKLLAWLPWFKATIVNPLKENGFSFETDKHVMTITCPIMILHAQDDQEVPVKLGEKLYLMASKRNVSTVYHEFDEKEEHRHNGIFIDPFMPIYLMNFIEISNSSMVPFKNAIK